MSDLKLKIPAASGEYGIINVAITVINVANISNNKDLSKAVIKVYNDLFDYTLYHFKAEETLMKQTNYHDYEQHKRYHDELVEKLSSYNLNHTSKVQKETVNDLLIFVGKWIMSHILNVDMKYMIHFEKNPIEAIEKAEIS